MSDSGLFSEFPSVTAKQWKQKIQFDLKGADYNDTLVWESNEGIKVKPFYHSEDLAENTAPQLKSSNFWKVGQAIYAGDAKKANTKALDALQRGVESIIFDVPDTEVDFGALLAQIDVSRIPLHFRFGFLDSRAIENLYASVGGKKTNFHLHTDPIGNLAKSGNWHHNLQRDHEILETIGQQAVKYQTETWLGVDLSLYQNAGANAVQQLAYAIAHTNEYLNHFQKRHENGQGIPIAVNFTVAIGGNYFFEIAKIRALRWLWKTLNTAYSYNYRSHILALPSKRNKTLYDYNVNMLRTTSECMSAVLGGADTVCNLPYDALYHKDNEFGERIARNQLLLLKEESYFKDAGKASEGSYYIETLTKQLAEKAWKLFQQIESSGGFLSELKKGAIQRKIKESADKEQEQFNTGQLKLLGTNTYQNPKDLMKTELELYPFVKSQPRKTLLVPIIERRLAEEMEQKRLEDE